MTRLDAALSGSGLRKRRTRGERKRRKTDDEREARHGMFLSEWRQIQALGRPNHRVQAGSVLGMSRMICPVDLCNGQPGNIRSQRETTASGGGTSNLLVPSLRLRMVAVTMLVATADREATASGSRDTAGVVFGRRRSIGPKFVGTILVLALLTLPSVAQTSWELITPGEEASDRAAPHVPGPMDLPAPPEIELLRPDISAPIKNPVTIEARFRAGPGASIDMGSFKAVYGWLGINITSRLLEHASKTPNGLVAENIDIPSGDHKVTLSIADSNGKTASRTFQFSVAR